MYYLYRYYMVTFDGSLDVSKLTLFDSTTSTKYGDRMVAGTYGYFMYIVRGKTTRPIESNIVGVRYDLATRLDGLTLAAAVAPGGVTLKWPAPSGVNVAKYVIMRVPKSNPEDGIDRKNFLTIDSVSAATQTYLDSAKNLTALAYSYFIQVRATDGRTYQSSIATVVWKENIVLTLAPSFDSDDAIKLQWTKPVSSGAKYSLIYRNLSSGSSLDSTQWLRVDSVTGFEWKDYARNLGSTTLVGYRVGVILEKSVVPSGSNTVLMPFKTPPPAPFVLRGEAHGAVVELAWSQPSISPVAKYFIYRATLTGLKLDSTAAFVKTDSTATREITTTIKLTNPKEYYGFYVEAVGTTTKAKSNALIAMVSNEPKRDEIKIVSDPVEGAAVGKLYTYAPKAVSSDSTANFTWSLYGSVPGGMNMDSTGKISWTPALPGWQKIVIGVKSSLGGYASQEIQIRVAGGTGKVHGLVADSLGNGIPFVLIKLVQKSGNPFEYVAVTDSAGNYNLDLVGVGSYRAFASPIRGKYLPVWYPNAKTAEGASLIVVPDSSDIAVDFVLQSRELVIPKFRLAGTVSDTAGAAIVGAAVIWARADFFLNAAKSILDSSSAESNYRKLFEFGFGRGLNDGFRLDGTSRDIFTAFTNTAGRYSLKLPKGAYVGIVFAQGYRRLLYNNKTDLLSVDIMRLSTDTSAVDFALAPLPLNATLGGLSGQVLDSAKAAGVPARVIAYRNLNDNRLPDAYYVDSDTSGFYSLSGLPAGKYFVLAVPLGTYAPSFYTLTGSTLQWKKATLVDVNGAAMGGINIFVRFMSDRSSGITFVSGTVGAPGTAGPSGLKKSTQLYSVGQGVNGTVVYVSDSAGTIAGYGLTDESGNFSVSDLAPGSYTVTVDRIGYQTTSSLTVQPGYDAQGNPIPATATFTLTPDSSSTIVTEKTASAPVSFVLEQNYPNPFNPSTTIRFSIPQTARTTLVIYNILGQKVATLVDGVTEAGSYNMSWNAANVASGVYIYQVKSNNFTSTKKMMLLR